MAGLEIRSFRNEDNSVSMVVLVPPRRNGEVNFGALARINRELISFSPDAFDPNEAIGVLDRNQDKPYDIRQHHAVEAPMPPHVEALIERAEDDDDPQVGSLKAGEAEREHADGGL